MGSLQPRTPRQPSCRGRGRGVGTRIGPRHGRQFMLRLLMQNTSWVPFAVAILGFTLTIIYDRVKNRRKKLVLLYKHTPIAPGHDQIKGLTVRFNGSTISNPVITQVSLVNFGRTDLLRKDFDGDSLRIKVASKIHAITARTSGSVWAMSPSEASMVHLHPSVVKRHEKALIGLLCDGAGEVRLYNGLGNVDIDSYEEGDFRRKAIKRKKKVTRLIGLSLMTPRSPISVSS
jgi:hypothetical protein